LVERLSNIEKAKRNLLNKLKNPEKTFMTSKKRISLRLYRPHMTTKRAKKMLLQLRWRSILRTFLMISEGIFVEFMLRLKTLKWTFRLNKLLIFSL
jgi:hypothetical protein